MATIPKLTCTTLRVKIVAEGAEQVALLNDLLQNKGLIKEGIIDYCKKHKLPYTEL